MIDTWVLLALGAALAWACVNLLDKVLIERLIPRASVLVVLDGVAGAAAASLIWLVYSEHRSLDVVELLPSLFSGVLIGLFTYAYYAALRQADASLVALVLQLVPMFSVLIGISVFSETLDLYGWVGIALIVGGSTFASIGSGSAAWGLKTSTRLARSSPGPLVLLVLGTACAAAAYALQKGDLAASSQIDVFFASRIGMLPIALLLLLGTGTRRSVLALTSKTVLPSRRSRSWLLAAEVILNLAGVFLLIGAYASGPLALVVPVASVQPLFVIGLIVLVNAARPSAIPDQATRPAVQVRVPASVAMIVGAFLMASARSHVSP